MAERRIAPRPRSAALALAVALGALFLALGPGAPAQESARIAGGSVVIGPDERRASLAPACAEPAGRTVQVYVPGVTGWVTGSAALVRIPGGAGQTVFLTAARLLYDTRGETARLWAERDALRIGLERRAGGECRLAGARIGWTRLIRAGGREGALAVFRLVDHDSAMRGAEAPALADADACPGQSATMASMQPFAVRDRVIRQACRLSALPGSPAGGPFGGGVLIGHGCDAGRGALGAALACRAGSGMAAVAVHAGGAAAGGVNAAVRLTPAIIAEIAAITPP